MLPIIRLRSLTRRTQPGDDLEYEIPNGWEIASVWYEPIREIGNFSDKWHIVLREHTPPDCAAR